MTENITDEQSEHYSPQAVREGFLPIREVARNTGINAAALRAWEHRYGLIVPYRPPKWHRLYSLVNFEHISTILTWLSRGVAVSQSQVPAGRTESTLAETVRCPLGAQEVTPCSN